MQPRREGILPATGEQTPTRPLPTLFGARLVSTFRLPARTTVLRPDEAPACRSPFKGRPPLSRTENHQTFLPGCLHTLSRSRRQTRSELSSARRARRGVHFERTRVSLGRHRQREGMRITSRWGQRPLRTCHSPDGSTKIQRRPAPKLNRLTNNLDPVR